VAPFSNHVCSSPREAGAPVNNARGVHYVIDFAAFTIAARSKIVYVKYSRRRAIAVRGGAAMNDTAGGVKFIDQTASIVAAYVSKNAVPAEQIPALISQVHSALLRIAAGKGETMPESLKPAVPVKKSVTPEYIVCLEDGKKFKSLKRHLRTQYDMTPEQYREKWALPADYPMVAPNYAAARSRLAKQMGLGQQRRRRR
jgi:predicted transcriptional regulator